MVQCNMVVSPKDSNIRFFLRLSASWLLFLAMWSGIIMFSSIGVLGTCLFVGHHIITLAEASADSHTTIFHPPFESHNFSYIVMDMIGGVLIISILFIFGAFIFFVVYNIKCNHYDSWYVLEVKYIQQEAENDLKSQQKLRRQQQEEEPLIEEFSDLEDYDGGEKKYFWYTIPEYLKLKYYYDKVCPRCSIRRYVCYSTFYTMGDLILLFLAAVCIGYVGSMITREGMFIDKRTGLEIGGIPKMLAYFGFGLILTTILVGAGLIIWNFVITSCIREWHIHQTKRLAAISKEQ